MKQFKITYTLGPATSTDAIIQGLLPSADKFRLNASHLDADELTRWLRKLASVFQSNKRMVPVAVDLQGAKMRIGHYPARDTIPAHVTLALGKITSSPEVIPVPHLDFFKTVKPGDLISLNDARVQLKIISSEWRKDGQAVGAEAEVIKNGPLSPNKGINRENHPIPYQTVTESDMRAIEASLAFPFVEYAASFVDSGEEARLLRPLIDGHRLIAKLERAEAIAAIDNIDKNFDELWLCRGDLGAQAGLHRLGELQDIVEARLQSLRHPCFLAGQVLEHMTHFPQPTRSEVVHLHHVIKRGFAGIVLSDETAIGKNPLDVAGFIQSFIRLTMQDRLL
jgi:pyruvate kinase